MPDSPHKRATIRPPHPLALRLIERLRDRPRSRVLDFGTGRGRNADALRAAGLTVVAIDDGAAEAGVAPADSNGTFAAAVSTHALLHGTLPAIAQRLASIATQLEPEGLFYATFGSVRDARYGQGRAIAPATFAPVDGDERGIAHTYFTRAGLEALLRANFVLEELEEREVDEIAGAWAHPHQRLRHAVHWLVVARRVSTRSRIGLEALA
jgi:hypothetical protein